jgi:putative inorganic carbon (hco3(-)) transporter
VTDRFTFNPPSPVTSRTASAGHVSPSPGTPRIAALGDPVAAAVRRKKAETEPRDWAFTWTLVFTAVLFLRPQDIFPPLDVLHLAELSALAALVSLFTGRLARRQSITRVTPELVGVLAFGAVILLTAPFSIWFGGAIGTFQDLYMKVILVYLLAVNVLISPKRLERLTWVLVLALGFIAFRAVVDYARGVNVIRGGTRVMGSVGGLMQNPNDLALNMIVFVPLAAFLAMRPGPLFKRLVAAGCAVFMMGAIVASGSRGGFLGFAVMLLVLAAFNVRKHTGFVVAGAFAVICALPLVPGSYWQRMASITDESKDDVQSSQARRRLMGEAWDAFVENPVTGVGAGLFKDYKPLTRTEAWHEAHNVWLQTASELGIFGLAAFTFLVFRAFYAVFTTRRLLRWSGSSTADTELLDAHSAAMAASLAGWFVCALFSSVAYNWTFYYLLALAAAPREILKDGLLSAKKVRAMAVSLPAAARAGRFSAGRIATAKGRA